MKPTQMRFRWMDKEIVEYMLNRVQHSSGQRWNSGILYKMDRLQGDYVKWNKWKIYNQLKKMRLLPVLMGGTQSVGRVMKSAKCWMLKRKGKWEQKLQERDNCVFA